MANWEFEELPASLVEQELTQRDQFNNDEVELAEALVREVIQNSTDAPAGNGPVKVRFAIVERTGEQAGSIEGLFTALRPHLKACDVDDAVLDQPTVRLLLVEDFNTRGLTGNPAALDNDNFHNFWRRHGKSGKAESQAAAGDSASSFFPPLRKSARSSASRSGPAMPRRSSWASPCFRPTC